MRRMMQNDKSRSLRQGKDDEMDAVDDSLSVKHHLLYLEATYVH